MSYLRCCDVFGGYEYMLIKPAGHRRHCLDIKSFAADFTLYRIVSINSSVLGRIFHSGACMRAGEFNQGCR
jgi:hypothetical protein